MQRRRFDLLLAVTPALGLSGARYAAAAEAPPTDQWFIFLETGRKTPDDPAAVSAMQRGHIDNFKRLFAQQRLLAAGPLRDPAGKKRGIVVLRAASRDELAGYFQPDDYVREGYMTVDAVPAVIHKALNAEGIDDTKIEEVRIVQISRDAAAPDAAAQQARRSLLQGLLDRGTIGAWYTLAEGPVAEVLFAHNTDSAALEAAFATYPGLSSGGVTLAVWSQWLSPGVVR